MQWSKCRKPGLVAGGPAELEAAKKRSEMREVVASKLAREVTPK